MSEQPAAENDYAIVPLVIHGECKVSLLTPISPLYNLGPITQIGHRKKKRKKKSVATTSTPKLFYSQTMVHNPRIFRADVLTS